MLAVRKYFQLSNLNSSCYSRGLFPLVLFLVWFGNS